MTLSLSLNLGVSPISAYPGQATLTFGGSTPTITSIFSSSFNGTAGQFAAGIFNPLLSGATASNVSALSQSGGASAGYAAGYGAGYAAGQQYAQAGSLGGPFQLSLSLGAVSRPGSANGATLGVVAPNTPVEVSYDPSTSQFIPVRGVYSPNTGGFIPTDATKTNRNPTGVVTRDPVSGQFQLTVGGQVVPVSYNSATGEFDVTARGASGKTLSFNPQTNSFSQSDGVNVPQSVVYDPSTQTFTTLIQPVVNNGDVSLANISSSQTFLYFDPTTNLFVPTSGTFNPTTGVYSPSTAHAPATSVVFDATSGNFVPAPANPLDAQASVRALIAAQSSATNSYGSDYGQGFSAGFYAGLGTGEGGSVGVSSLLPSAFSAASSYGRTVYSSAFNAFNFSKLAGNASAFNSTTLTVFS